jgi:glycosyltransferase involved in cell wall biosynthesis
MFNVSDNVLIKGYMSEDELRNQMNQSDVSINVMDDTVGSNVITTSLAMGLALVVTDVGSIRDYCSDKNAVFCENTAQSLILSVNELAGHVDKVKKMGRESLEFSSNLSIENVDAWFDSLK